MTATRPVVILWGASGAIVAEALYDFAQAGGDLHCAGYLNVVLGQDETIAGLPVLGPFERWMDLPENTLFISVLHKATRASARMAS